MERNKMTYLDKEMTRKALKNMMGFHQNLCAQFSDWGMDFRSNLGRRNVVMSQAQEHFFARELSKSFRDVESDGRTGKADIVIGEISKELECKMTSGSGQYRAFALQTDYATLENKESLDYLYVLADEKFKQFAVLHFENLTPDDFHLPASGSRGKARMKKEKAMKRCRVLWGSALCRNHSMIDSIEKKIRKSVSDLDIRVLEISGRISACSDRAVKKKQNLIRMLDRETSRYEKKIKKLSKKRDYWKTITPQFTFNLEPLS